MRAFSYSLTAILVVLVLILATACGGDEDQSGDAGGPAPTGSGSTEKATLRIGATDAPPEGVTKILITVSNIQVQASGADPWLTVVAGPVEFDLVEIQGVEEVLGEAQLDPGRYGQIRLDV